MSGNPSDNTILPLVSIGMPLYNEERYIRDSMAAILAQDYGNLEIIISDNCSTDHTADICSELSQGDERVRIVRQEVNVGAAANFLEVMKLASGRYFMWASGHDLWSANLVSDSVRVLEAHPAAAIAYAKSDWIGAAGEQLDQATSCYDTGGMNGITRFFMTFWGNMHPILGVIRMSCLRRIPTIHKCAGTDLIILAELALCGEFLLVPGVHWSRRQPRPVESHKQRMNRYRNRDFALVGHWLDRMFPLLRLPLELFRVVGRSSLPFRERLVIMLALPGCFLVRYIAGVRQ